MEPQVREGKGEAERQGDSLTPPRPVAPRLSSSPHPRPFLSGRNGDEPLVPAQAPRGQQKAVRRHPSARPTRPLQPGSLG